MNIRYRVSELAGRLVMIKVHPCDDHFGSYATKAQAVAAYIRHSNDMITAALKLLED